MNHGRRLLPVEPANKVWRDYTADAELDLARFLLSDGQQEQAAVHARASCELIDGLIASDSSAPEWRAGLRDCWRLRARMALMTGAVPRAVEDARRAVDIARSVKTIP